mgnify:FL=1|jgi:hypothetical protein
MISLAAESTYSLPASALTFGVVAFAALAFGLYITLRQDSDK